jgi:acetyltransferase
MTDKQKWGGTSKILKDGEIPCFDFAETAARALYALVRYNRIRLGKEGIIQHFTDIDKERIGAVLENARAQNREILSAFEVYSILEACKIPVAAWKIANNTGEVVSIANGIGFPVVIKADSEKLIHKSDAGGVVVNIKDISEAKEVVKKMQKNLGGGLKFLVQKYIPGGRELIIGAKADNGAGNIIMFGLGGIFVEVLKDVSFSINPVSDVEAMEMITSVKAAPLINGYRGEKGINKERTAEIIQRISMLVSEFQDIKELDLNPLIANGNDICIVDARIIL